MATVLNILSVNDQKSFENPPHFSGEKRKQAFFLNQTIEQMTTRMRTPTNQAGFVLQLGYFRVTNRFFPASRYSESDVRYVCNQLHVFPEEIDLSLYTDRTLYRHQSIILDHLGYSHFDKKNRNLLEQEAINLSNRQIKPRFMFWSLVDFLSAQRIEIPGYYIFADIVTQTLRNFENIRIKKIEALLTPEQRKQLNALLKPNPGNHDSAASPQQRQQYPITVFKTSDPSLQPFKIKNNLHNLQSLKEIYTVLKPLLDSLQLSPDLIDYYAQFVLKTKISHALRWQESKILYLICFVVDRYFRLNDLLVDKYLHVMQTHSNTCQRKHKELLYKAHHQQNQSIHKFCQSWTDYLSVIDAIRTIVQNSDLDTNKKLEHIQNTLPKVEKENDLVAELTLLDHKANESSASK